MNPAHLLKAIAFAADKHRRQRRKDVEASPYINHPIAVATVLSLEEHFGPEVAGVVRELTDDKTLGKVERKRLQIEHALQSSSRAKQVKIADKICNIRDITISPPADWSVERRKEYLRWSEKVVAGCRHVNVKLDQAFDCAIAAARSALNMAVS